MTDRRVPSHLLMLVGVSAGAYAVSLAAVTGLQSGADARLLAQRAPIQAATEVAAAEHGALESALQDAARRYAVLAERYDRVGVQLAEMESGLDALATRAATLSESAAALPTRISLPRVAAAPRVVSAPRTQATTRASGG